MAEIYFLNRESKSKEGRNCLRLICGLLHNIWYVLFTVYAEGTKLFPKKLPVSARQLNKSTVRYTYGSRICHWTSTGTSPLRTRGNSRICTVKKVHARTYVQESTDLLRRALPTHPDVSEKILTYFNWTQIPNIRQTHHLLWFLIIFIDSRYFEPVSFFSHIL
jgi:hypothetical protein